MAKKHDSGVIHVMHSSFGAVDSFCVSGGRLWDGYNSDGQRAANGLYLLQGRLNTAQGVFKARTKIALLR